MPTWTTNLHKAELEIWTGCNLACPNCDRSSAQAPSREGMSVAQVRYFVTQSLELDWRWDRIVILGGEPTLHPNLGEVVAELDRLKCHSPETEFRLYSNGFGNRVRARLAEIPDWITVQNSGKDRSPPLFSAYNVAPVDLEGYEFARFDDGCAVTQWCGLGVTRHGIYPCGAGAAIDRVFGLGVGLRDLRDVTANAVRKQLSELCRLCGHFRDFERKVDYVRTRNPIALDGWVREQVSSPSWVRAYAKYQQAAPKLPLYPSDPVD